MISYCAQVLATPKAIYLHPLPPHQTPILSLNISNIEYASFYFNYFNAIEICALGFNSTDKSDLSNLIKELSSTHPKTSPQNSCAPRLAFFESHVTL
jgi:hypothetical protein